MSGRIRRNTQLIEASAQFPPEALKLKRICDLYRAERHTPDRAGYLRYIEDVNKPMSAFLRRPLIICLNETDRKKHSFAVSQSGSGKSETMKVLAHAYLTNPNYAGTLVIIDPANDFAEEISRFKELAGDERVIYIDPILFSEHTPTINPFEVKDTSEETIHIMSEQLSSVFQELLRKGGYAEMSGNMKTLLIPCLSTLLRLKESNLCDLLAFMNDNLNAKLHAEGLRSPFPSHQEFFKHNFYEKKYEFTKAAIASRVQSLLNSPVLYNLLIGRSTFDLEKAVNAGKVIIFALPKGGAGEETSSTFGSFVLGLLQGIAIKRFKSPKEDRLPIHVFVDECQNFLSTSVKTILTESRKYGLHLTLAQQYYGQDLDKDLLGAIMGNTAIKIVGQNDVYTLKKMDERLNVGVEELQKLKCGEFFIKVSGDKPAFKIYVHSHLVGNKNSVTDQEWADFKHQQQAKYYRPIAQATTPPLTGQMVSVESGARETKQPPKYVELI